MKKYIITTAAVALIGVGFYNKVYLPKHTYKTLSASKGEMDVKVNGVGEVGAKNIYKIGSIYGGKVLDFQIQEGELIKKTTLVATVDSVDLKDKIKELEASIKKLKSDVNSLKIDKKSAKTSANYQKEILKKNQELYKKGAISELDFKKFETNAITASLSVESIFAKINSLHSQKVQLEASLSGLYEKLSRFSIKAPVSGYVTKKYISNFAIINPNQNIIDIVNPKDVWVATHIDTRISGNIKIGDKATVTLRSSSKKYSATVVNIKPINNNITYEREIDVAFDKLPIPFYLQEQAIVDININTLHNITKIPSRALSIYNEEQGVWVLKDDVVHFQPLKILAYGDKSVATKSLPSNVELVLPDAKKKALKDGMKINHD